MKSLLRVTLIFMALASFCASAEGYISHRVYSTSAQSEKLPTTLHFEAKELKVLNENWFTTLFSHSPCESALSGPMQTGRLELKVRGDHSLELSLNGVPSKHIHEAYATYVPIYLHNSSPVHPHFLIHIPGWVTFYVRVHKDGEKKEFELSLVKHKPGQEIRLLPILEATGI